MKKLFSVLSVFFVLGFVGCDDGSTTKNKCDDVNCNEWESCVEATGVCVANAGKCNTNTDCTIAGQTCNTTNHTCEAQTVECSPVCDSWETCNNGVCVVNAGKCNTNADCTVAGQTCNTTNHTCEAQTVECSPVCDSWETCNNGVCVVNAGKCNTNTDCTVAGQTCNTTNHTCEAVEPECTTSADCTDVAKPICDNGVCVAEQGECIGLSVEDIEADVEYPNVLVGYAGDLEISIEFYEETLIGSYDLTSSLNNNYEYCEQCVLVYEPLDENWNNFKTYFQTAGTLEIIAGEGTSGESEGVLTTITLKEVTIEDETFISTLVPNGGCYEIQTATWNTIEQ